MVYVLVALVLFALYLVRKKFSAKARPPLPPGPKKLPLVGNIADLPPNGKPEYLHWLEHRDLYGIVDSFQPLDQNVTNQAESDNFV
jgi:hypothetical protein